MAAVVQVSEGDRFILAMWFTCSEEHQYVNVEEE